jgi:hypothetical protein
MKHLVGILLLLLSSLSLAGCRQTEEWNQKLTVTVETPSGDVSGSAVVYEKVWVGQLPASSSSIEYDIKGEATIVEVAPGKYLFALLDNVEERAARTFTSGPNEDNAAFWSRLATTRESRPLAPNAWPMLVTFGNLNDPKSVKQVNPKNLAAIFGPGYALKSITLEITDEPVTIGEVEKVLGRNPADGSLNKIWNSLTSGQRSILSSVNWTQG